jgi:hypothetical protein
MPPRGFVAAARASQPPAPRFRSGVDVVEVAVLAEDREGKPITDLTRDEICRPAAISCASPAGPPEQASRA